MCLPKPSDWKCHAGRARPVLWGSGCPRSARCRTERGRNRHWGALREAVSQRANRVPGGGWQRLSPCGLGGRRGRAPSSQPRAGQGDSHCPWAGSTLTVGSQGQLQAATVPTRGPLTCYRPPCSQFYPSSHQLTFHCLKVISQPHTLPGVSSCSRPHGRNHSSLTCAAAVRRAAGLLRDALPPSLQPLAHLQTDRSFSPHEGHVVGETGQYSALRKTGREFRAGTEGS